MREEIPIAEAASRRTERISAETLGDPLPSPGLIPAQIGQE